jgi:hypothetical protein
MRYWIMDTPNARTPQKLRRFEGFTNLASASVARVCFRDDAFSPIVIRFVERDVLQKRRAPPDWVWIYYPSQYLFSYDTVH